MKNVNVTLDTICALSRISSTNMDMKESVFNVIKNDILSHEINNLIYFAIPMWSYSKGTWNKDIPVFYANKDYCELYKKFFVCLKELDFSFVDFISTKLKTIPLYVDIEYVDGPLTDYCNSVDLDRIRIFFSKSSIINLKVEDILSIQETDAEFKKFSFRLLDHIVNSDVNVALKLYKFLAIYTIYFKTDLKYITIINSILYKPTSTSKDIGYGGAIVVLKKELSEMAKRLISIVLNIKHKEIAISDWIEKNTIDLQKESIKSAVSAIMTRNMSHNLGSHYLHYTKAQLEQLAKRGGEFGPDIRGAARVMGYMQGRMDYLATLISMDRYPYGCVNFKSQIYDELTIDDFSKRHFKYKNLEPDELYKKIEILCQKMVELQSIQSRLQDKQNEKNIVAIDIEFRKFIESNLKELHTVSGDALINENSNRTTNFLLNNLILSENFTRLGILEDYLEETKKLNMINLQVLLFNNNQSEIFTGALNNNDKEEEIKRKLSKVNIAMPGGLMSCHAFFNIIENFIRNSAKYLQSDFNKNTGLIITIKIEEVDGEYNFTIYDNKHNANKKILDQGVSLLDFLHKKLENLSILDENYAVEKRNKGFKEMLFSALWLRSYVYKNEIDEAPKNYADVLARIQYAKKEDRIELIKRNGFSLLAVDDYGVEDASKHANLALRFTLPKFEEIVSMELLDKNLSVNLRTILNNYGDIACVDSELFNSFVEQMNAIRSGKDTYENDMIIPRMVSKDLLTNPENPGDDLCTNVTNKIFALKTVLHKRFGDEFEDYHLIFSKKSLKRASSVLDSKRIKFARHLSTKDKMDLYAEYAYADSISGGNFTITLADVLTRWENDGYCENSDAYYQILKIKESALTRITLIDERFFKKMQEQKTELELACKNIRVLNYNESMSMEEEYASFMNLFEGNEFNSKDNKTHFLSIHLGIIEKIIKNVTMFKYLSDDNEKVCVFMKMLKEHFGPKVYISIHSGRGNFSAELEDSLDMYPFVSMAALENAFENSKYLLCQLFYSTIYIGKGVANQYNN